MRLCNIVIVCAVGFVSGGSIRAEEKLTQAAIEKKFAETLSGAELVGYHTDSDKPADKLTEERYILSSVSKLKDDYWLFMSRIQYGKRDIAVPLSLQVKWAGDTPVITLTDLAIPLLGKFSARVVIYNGSYAGTWSGAKHGGHLFGKIEKKIIGATLRLDLDEEDAVSIDGKKYTLEELEKVLREKSKAAPIDDATIAIVATDKTKAGALQKVVAICQKCGFRHIITRIGNTEKGKAKDATEAPKP